MIGRHRMTPVGYAVACMLAMALAATSDRGQAQSGAGFEVRRSTVDGGGGRSTGTAFEATGTIGQPDAGQATGGPFEVRGGFWATAVVADATDAVFSDGFEPR